MGRVRGARDRLRQGIRARIATLFQNTIMRSIGVLVSGTATAHLITALALPVSTRLYSPSDFSVAATFSSLLGILAVASCLRFEIAIPLPEKDQDAANLFALSVTSALCTALLLAVIVAVLPRAALAAIGFAGLTPYLWLMPLAVLASGLYLAMEMWFIRRKGFRMIASSRIGQALAAATGNLSLGAAGFTPLGLIVGQMLNYGVGSATLGTRAIRRDGALLRRVTPRDMAAAFRSFSRFPRYSIWEALANSASVNAPILLIAALALGPEPGYLILAMFLLQVPMTLFGGAVSQVYLSGASEALREGRFDAYTLGIIEGLLRAAIAPMLILAIASPAAFGLVFGGDWVRSGELVSWMMPWFLMQLLSSPVSSALHVLGRQRIAMLLQFGGFTLRCGSVLLAAAAWRGFISETYAISGFVFYTTYVVVVLRTVGLKVSDLRRPIRQALWPALFGIVVGLAMIPLFLWLQALAISYGWKAPPQ